MELFKQIDGSCPYCGGTVIVVEGTVEEMILSKSGEQAVVTSSDHRIAGMCSKCKKPVFIMPRQYGDGYLAYKYEIASIFARMFKPVSVVSMKMPVEDNAFIGNNEDTVPFDGPYIDIKEEDIR